MASRGTAASLDQASTITIDSGASGRIDCHSHPTSRGDRPAIYDCESPPAARGVDAETILQVQITGSFDDAAHDP